MRACLRGRASRLLLWSALIVVAASHGGNVRVAAQVQGQRWDGLIELISGKYLYPPPSSMPPAPADGPSQMSRHAVSADGRYIVFSANAPSLGSYSDALYLRDRRTGDTRLLLSGSTRDAVISADGRHVAFAVCDPYMRPDNAPICDVWTIDLQTWSWVRLSADPHQGDFGNDHSDGPVLSGDGRFAVFRTAATNLVQGVPAGVPQLVIRDRDADGNGIFDEPGPGTLEIVSARDGSATTAGNGPSATAEVSDDGRYVSFRSAADNLVHGDTNGGWDVFRRDRLARDTQRLNRRPYPAGSDQSPASVDSPAISMTPDGRFVAFTSEDGLLAPSSGDDINNARDVFVFDAESPYLQRLDVGWGPPVAGGYVPGNRPTEWPTLSMDGRYVSLQSRATNVETPSASGSFQTYVVDRVTGGVTRVSLRPDGTEPDRECVRPSISLDGTVVTYVSQAFNLAPNVYTEHDRIYAAVHFEVTPAEQFVPGGAGGSATYEIATQQHTLWWVDWQDWQPWVEFASPPMSVGNGTLTLTASQPNPAATPRSSTIRILDRSAVFTQLEGLSITTVSPAVGPGTGGTQVTITGTGFEPGMRVIFGGLDAVTTEVVSSTTVIATTPAHAPGTVWVGILSQPPDHRNAWIDAAFHYTDTTPPQLWSGFSDSPNADGWFNRDVTLYWAWMDHDAPVTSTSGCDTAVIGVDTPGTTYTCTATSEGGTSTLSATVKRDATAPTAIITSPQSTLYDINQVVQPAFSCSDATSGVASCVGSTNGGPVDTSTPGYHSFVVSMTDLAGNPSYSSVEYAVGSGVCASPLPDMVGWWRMEGNTSNTRSGLSANATRAGLTSDVYADAIVGQGYQFEGTNGYLLANYSPTILSDKKFAVAAWVNPSANTRGTIMRARDLFGVARLETGTIGWAWRKWNDSTLSYRDTRVPLPLGRWSHVVVMLDGFAVRTYLNGRLAHTEPNVGDVINTGGYPLSIGGAQNVGDFFKGVIDEVQIFQHGLSDAQIEQLVLAGNAGACVPKQTSLQIVEPIPASFGSPTYAFDVRLVDEDGQPVAGRAVQLMSQVGAAPYSTSTANRVTDADGRAHWDAPLKNAPRGLFESFASATFTGDLDYVRTSVGPDVLVGKGRPIITWPAPAPITYGFPVNGTQLNATASVPGAFSYAPPSGTLLPAGERTLSVTFTPADTANYDTVTATNTLSVTKATPTVVIEGVNPWAYTGTAPTIVGKVKDRLDNVIATPTLTYDGSPDLPTMPGSYTVVANFAGNANYEPASATTTLTITKRAVDIQIFAPDITYDAIGHLAGYLISGLYPEYLTADSLTYNGSEDTPVNVGTYTVVVTYNGSSLYEAATATKTFVIRKATPTVTITGGTFAYSGTPRPASGTVHGGGGLSLGAPVLTYNGASEPPVNGGTYNVVGTFAGDANHHPATGSATITIDKVVPVVTVTGGTYTYDGLPHAATASVTGVGGAQVSGLVVTYNGSTEPPVSANGYVVTATYAGDANYQAITRYSSIQINPATPVVTITGGTFTYDGQPHGAVAAVTGIGGVDVGPATLTYDGSANVPVNAGTYVALAVFNGSGNYGYAARSALLTIQKAAAVLSWSGPAPIVYGTPLGAGQLNAASSVSGSFSYSPAAGAVLNAGGSQVLTATFTPADSSNYSGGSVTTTIAVAKATATVTATGGTFSYDGQPHPASGSVTGLNGLSIGAPSFTYNGSTAPPVNAGSHAVVASFAGDANYEPASATATITIGKAAVVLNWAVPQAIGYGTALGSAQLNATSNVPGTFAYSPAAGTVLTAGGSQVLTATFTPADSSNYSGGSVTATIAVAKATATVTATGGIFSYDGQPHPASGSVTGLNGLSIGTPSFTYNGSAAPPINAGSHAVVASFAGDANYEPASATATITIGKAPVALTWNAPAAIVYGTPLGVAQLNASSNVPGTFTYSPAAGAVLNAGASQALTATFTPADSANHTGGSVTATIAVAKATATVTATGGTFSYDGQPHAATGSVTGLNGLSIGTPSFTYNGSAAPPVNAGSHAVVASFAGDANYEPASATATITIGKAPVVLTWNGPAPIVYGTPLGAAQLNAASNVPGTFAYSPAGGTVLTAGAAHALTATFTPADAANYTVASVGNSIAVTPRPLTVRANDSAKPFGAPLPVFTASAVGLVNGDTFASLSGALAFATSATPQSAVGTYPVTPSGLSSLNYAVTFATGALTVVRGGVTVSVSTSPAPSGLNQPMTFTANVVAVAPAAGTPGGTVRFFDGATLLGGATLSNGTVAFTTAGLAAGLHTIEARYDGDASFATGSGSASHTVNSAAATPSITIASNRNPSSVGQSVTLTATLSMSAGAVSGTVQFYDGAALLGTSAIVSGSATFTTTALAAGSHAVTVRYPGSASAPPAISGVFVQAVGATGWKNRVSSTSVSASPNPSAPGGSVTLTATITGTSGTPAGAVLFMVNGQAAGGPVTLTATSGSSAQATFALPGLAGGRHIVTATYLGNSNYKGSTATVTQAVN